MPRTPLLFALLLSFGCKRDEPAPSADASEAQSAGVDGLYFADLAIADARDGEIVAPVLEVSGVYTGTLDLAVVVQRGAGTEPVIELWRYASDASPRGFARLGEPMPLLRTRVVGGPSKGLEVLRQRMAENLDTRLEGVAAEHAAALLTTLMTAAKTVRDAQAPDRARVDALVQVFRGLENEVLFERDEIGTVLERLAEERWIPERTHVGEFERVQVETAGGDRLDLEHDEEGWMIEKVWWK
ncbi:MAG: hypothetical protein IAG13_30835 [Deltaproteobacteria bacterium]|nr:hypothetical protein [Nannocystaceae bacterium]